MKTTNILDEDVLIWTVYKEKGWGACPYNVTTPFDVKLALFWWSDRIKTNWGNEDAN